MVVAKPITSHGMIIGFFMAMLSMAMFDGNLWFMLGKG